MKNIFLLFLVVILISCTKEIPDNPRRYSGYEGEYLGQKFPGDTAEVFGLGLVSTGLNERDAAFSPDLNEFYYSIWQNGKGSIVVIKKKNDKWTTPEVVSFSGIYSDIEPFITKDGSKLYYASNRPVEGKEPKDYDIWFVEKLENKWSEPKRMNDNINSTANEFYPSLTANGDIYFTSNNEKAMGREDIFVSRFENGEYQPYENLGDSVNSGMDEFNSFISEDGSYLVYTTTGFGDGLGGGDLWVTFRKNESGWTTPKNLGSGVNTNKLEYCPSITPDGKFLFFTSNRVNVRKYDKRQSYQQIVDEYNNPFNGSGDIYWVSLSVIKKLR